MPARRRRRTSPRRSRSSTSPRSSGRPTASTWATGRTANGSRRRAAASSISDDPKGPVGGNCYACHQLAPQEVSYGTIGPSLYQFGKLRGYGPDIQKYAYGKVWNAEAYNACSSMPRFGHSTDPDRGADQGRRRAADGSQLAGEQVTHGHAARRLRCVRIAGPCRLPANERACAGSAPHESPRVPAGHRRGGGRRACRWRARSRSRASADASFYDGVTPFGNVSLLHFTDCHAQLLPIRFREPNVNLGIGAAWGQPPHLVGEALLKHFGIRPGTRDAHAFTYLDFERAARSLRPDGRLRASRHAGEEAEGLAAGRAAARRRRHVAGLRHVAVDEGAGHGRRAEAAGRRRDDRATGNSRTAPIA